MKILLTPDGDLACIGNGISWRRLVDQLRRAGEFREDETVARLEIDEHGILYFVAERRR